MAKFPVGTVVKLKSGGPKMTVKEEVKRLPGNFVCTWFENGKVGTGTFSETTLERFEEGTANSTLSKGPAAVKAELS